MFKGKKETSSCYKGIPSIIKSKPTLTHTDDLIQALTCLCKQAIGQRPDRMWLGPAYTPIKRLGLVAEHITGLPCLASPSLPDCHGKRIISIVFRRGHGQPNDQRSFLVKNARREDKKWMNIPHFLANMRGTVNPDNRLAIRHPRAPLLVGRPLSHYQRSAPTG